MKVFKGDLAKEGNTLIDYIAQKLLEMLVELTGQKVINFQDWWLLHWRRSFAEWRSLVSTDYSVNRFLYGNISHVWIFLGGQAWISRNVWVNNVVGLRDMTIYKCRKSISEPKNICCSREYLNNLHAR